MRPLTPKQKIFVAEYLVDLNATQAAIRAGYSSRTAEWIGPQLLGKTHVAEEIRAAMAAREKRTEITQDRVLKELAKLGFSNMADYMMVGEDGKPMLDWARLTRDQAAAIVEVTVENVGELVTKTKFKLADKRASLVDIGKHLGMFVDRKEVKADILHREQPSPERYKEVVETMIGEV